MPMSVVVEMQRYAQERVSHLVLQVQWYSVGVRLVCVISPQLSLQQLRSETCLAGMDLFLRSRLSIQVWLDA